MLLCTVRAHSLRLPQVRHRCFSENIGKKKRELRVCVVGSGPSGLYVADFLLQSKALLEHNNSIKIDILERLPTPFGLVRHGVAPDHPEVKLVINKFSDSVLSDPRVRYFGNVGLGSDVSFDEIKKLYQIVILASGCDKDKKLKIPGEDTINGVYSARDFVMWYNCLPTWEKTKLDPFNLTTVHGQTAVIIGNGNVALDVARILLKPTHLLSLTDINPQTIKVLNLSKIKNVHIIGRRGPVQSAFTTKELRELTKLSDCRVVIANPEHMDVSPHCKQQLSTDRPTLRKFQLLEKILADQKKMDATNHNQIKTIFLHFLKSPVSFNSGNGDVSSPSASPWLSSVTLQHMKLAPSNPKKESDDQNLDVIALPDTSRAPETITASIAFRSVGFFATKHNFGKDSDKIPFDKKKGIVPNLKGKVVDLHEEHCDTLKQGLYVSGWLKRGPTGTIVSTWQDAEETANTIIHDILQGTYSPLEMEKEEEDTISKDVNTDLQELLKSKSLDVIDWEKWKLIDEAERQAGEKEGTGRVKFNNTLEILNFLKHTG